MKKQFFKDLEKLGIKNDDVLLVHSSFKSLGKTSFNGNDILGFFIEYLNKGTLILPALSHKYVNGLNPCFDSRKTNSCVGYLAETFRLNFNVVRSIHPTHSVCAIGKEAFSITEKHDLDNTPCGSNTPFTLLPKYGGKILMLGCGFKPNTSMHAIEEDFEPPYLFGDTCDYTIINKEGKSYNKKYRTHNFEGVEQRYDRIINSNQDNWIKRGKIFEAESFIMDAERLWKEAKGKLKMNANYYVQDINKN